MKNLIRLTDLSLKEIEEIFAIADSLTKREYTNILFGKTVVMLFPSTSIRTRITFEKGIHLLGGQVILFPSETLDKKEDLRDVIGYLNQWADLVVVRHKEIKVLEQLAECAKVPIINAMTDENHPCEMLSDLYALSKIREDFRKDKYLFCGADGNIGRAWKEAAKVMNFELSQCCKQGFELAGVAVYHDIREAVVGKDIICTDSLPKECFDTLEQLQVTKEIMGKANKNAVLNSCPPFYRGEEVSADVIESEYFVGYEFKKCLLEIQQAIMIYCMLN